jgi:beta-lactamase regulating signal transducer with metallopeptidase domain
MTIWMSWTLAASILLAFSATLIARVATYFGLARRFVWTGAMIIAASAPLFLPARALSIPWRGSSRALSSPVATPTGSLGALARDGSATTHAAIDWNALIRRADPWIAATWALWSCVLLVSLARAVAQLHRRRRTWEPVDTEIGRVFVAKDDGPAVVGWLAPQIVLPAWAIAEDASTRTLMLRHEREHLQAGDTRLLLLAEIIRRALPWNAAMWWMADRLRLAVEMDCDARVVHASNDAHAYGVMLLAVSERLGCELPFATSPLVSRGDLEQRLQVLGAERRRHPIVASIPYIAVALVVLVTAAWTPRPGFPARNGATAAAVDSDLVRVGYVQRKQAGSGMFMDGNGIDARARVFSEVFRAVPGLKASPSGDGKTSVITSEKVSDGCVSFYVDGYAWQGTAPGDIDNFVNPAQLLAIEVYQPPNAPAQFAVAGGPRCASIVAWTQAIRRRRPGGR